MTLSKPAVLRTALPARALAVPASVRLPVAAAALGLLAVGLAETGTGGRPALAWPVFLLGIAAAAAPLRAGVPVAIVLACLESTIVDFLGLPAGYWKEAFLVTLCLRSVAARRPSWRELAAWGAAGAVYLGYYLSGTSLLAVGWAAKILLFSVAASWALYRLRPRYEVWRATYGALAVVVGANLVVALWQRAVGVQGLLDLGLPYGTRIRQMPNGDLRVFGTFTTAAPFSYALALGFLAWLGLLLGRRHERRLALETAWVPSAAMIGISYAVDRIALVAVTVAVVVVALRSGRRDMRLGLLAIAPAAVALAFVFGGASRDFLAKGFLFRADSADARRALWSEYWPELSVFGTGPGAAGSAYERWAAKRRGLPVDYRGWYQFEPGPPPFRWMPTRASLVVGGSGARAAVTLTLLAGSRSRARQVAFRFRGTVLARKRVPVDVLVPLTVPVPAGRGPARVTLAASPPAARASPGDPRSVSIRVANVAARKGQHALTPAERIYERAVARGLGVSRLAGTGPGLVDNLYLSWLFQYGVVLGAVLCVLFLAALLWPMLRFPDLGSPLLTARLWGVFLALAAVAVNAWEEYPTDLLAALVFAQALAHVRRARA